MFTLEDIDFGEPTEDELAEQACYREFQDWVLDACNAELIMVLGKYIGYIKQVGIDEDLDVGTLPQKLLTLQSKIMSNEYLGFTAEDENLMFEIFQYEYLPED